MKANAKLISDGTPMGTKVILADGSSLAGIVSVGFNHLPGEFPIIEAQLAMIPVEAEGQLSVIALHPEGGLEKVAKIIWADGTEWTAP